MLAGKTISMMDTLGISIACMLVVFVALFILYVCVSLFPKVFRQKPPAAAPAAVPDASAAGEEDDGELLAIITAAIACYEQEQKKPTGIRMARNFKG